MTLSEFIEAGQTLYGPQWKRPVATALGIPERSLYNYLNGRQKLPADMRERLIWLATVRQSAMEDLRQDLLSGHALASTEAMG